MDNAKHPGKYVDILAFLERARSRLHEEALRIHQEEGRSLGWEDVEDILGPHISPRYEDREKIVSGLEHWVFARQAEKNSEARPLEKRGVDPEERKAAQTERKKATVTRKLMERLIREAVTEKALYRVPSIGKPGWSIRKRLQEIVPRTLGEKDEHFEIVGRGENKISFFENLLPVVQAHLDAGTPVDQIIERIGYPGDLVIQNRGSAKEDNPRPSTTWVVEVEPTGLNKIAKKLQVLTRALRQRFRLAQFARSGNQKGMQRARTQMPAPGRQMAVVFYTGTHPTLAESEGFLKNYASENAVSNLFAHVKTRGKRVYRKYHDAILVNHDQQKMVEQQLHEVLSHEGRREAILESPYALHWLVPIGRFLYLIDLKKASLLMRDRPEDILVRPDYVPAIAKRRREMVLHKNLQLPSLEALSQFGARVRVGEIRQGFLHK